MEKLRFTIRFFAILLSLPVVMFAELTRKDSISQQRKHVIEAKNQQPSYNSELVCQFPLLQAAYN